MRRQRMPVSNEEETVVFVLQFEPALKGAKIMTQMKTPGGPHAAQDSFALRHSKENPPPGKWRFEIRQPMLAQSAGRPASASLAPPTTYP